MNYQKHIIINDKNIKKYSNILINQVKIECIKDEATQADEEAIKFYNEEIECPYCGQAKSFEEQLCKNCRLSLDK